MRILRDLGFCLIVAMVFISAPQPAAADDQPAKEKAGDQKKPVGRESEVAEPDDFCK